MKPRGPIQDAIGAVEANRLAQITAIYAEPKPTPEEDPDWRHPLDRMDRRIAVNTKALAEMELALRRLCARRRLDPKGTRGVLATLDPLRREIERLKVVRVEREAEIDAELARIRNRRVEFDAIAAAILEDEE